MWRVYFFPIFIITGLYQLYKGVISPREYLDMIVLDILISATLTLTVNFLIQKFMSS